MKFSIYITAFSIIIIALSALLFLDNINIYNNQQSDVKSIQSSDHQPINNKYKDSSYYKPITDNSIKPATKIKENLYEDILEIREEDFSIRGSDIGSPITAVEQELNIIKRVLTNNNIIFKSKYNQIETEWINFGYTDKIRFKLLINFKITNNKYTVSSILISNSKDLKIKFKNIKNSNTYILNGDLYYKIAQEIYNEKKPIK